MEISDALNVPQIIRNLETKRNDDPNQFKKDLEESNSIQNTEWWNNAHRQAFKNVIAVRPCKTVSIQKSGIDRWVTVKACTDCGDKARVISVEEKLDGTKYTNIAFEVESTQGVSKGWAEKPIAADIFAYGFSAQNVVYYFCTQEFLSVWKDNATFWKRKYGERTVWSSRAIVTPVPVFEVIAQCKNTKTVHLPRD